MPSQPVKVRPVDAVENAKNIYRSFHSEMVVHAIGICNETILTMACIFFFEFMPKNLYLTGMVIWLAGCLVGAGVSGYHLWEYFQARSKYQGQMRHELLELTMYMICHVTYFAGCVLYLPWLYKTQKGLMVGHMCATWLWIWGSVALVCAGHWNAIGLLETTTKLPHCRRTTILRRTASVALTCTALGASLFLAGSFLFRPGFKNQCESPEAFESPEPAILLPHAKKKHSFAHMIEPDLMPITAQAVLHRVVGGPPEIVDDKLQLNPFCVSIIKQGTLLFLIGCIAFWIHAILNLACAVLLHKIRLEDAKREYTQAFIRGERSLSEVRGDSSPRLDDSPRCGHPRYGDDDEAPLYRSA